MSEYVAALDQGTTSTRFAIFDRDGRLRALDQMEHTQIYPEPGWVEHNADEIFEKTLKVIIGAITRGGLQAHELLGMGLTNQRETIVLWDKISGEPVYNAIVWQDVRTANHCERVEAEHGAFIRQRTGLPTATYFSASKIAWILDTVPGVRDRATKGQILAGTIDSWLVWKLSGGPQGGHHITDATNASRTLLMNLETLSWDAELCAIWNIPQNILPAIKSSSEVYCYTKVLAHNLPLAAILGDQQAALFGQACYSPGDTKSTYGTGCFLLMNTGKEIVRSTHGLISTLAYALPGKAPVYGLEGSVAMAGASLQWLRDNLGLLADASEAEAIAARVQDNGGVYFVPAFSGLFAPYWRPDARGCIAGLTRYANKAHLVRAALEATAYQTLDTLRAMEKDTGHSIPCLKVDGGMTANMLLMQFQADILNASVSRPRVIETTALGAAYAAGLALGFWSGVDELASQWQEAQRWNSSMPESQRHSLLEGWRKALDKSLNWESTLF